ncbi:cysteine protease [Yasminevirus sp. GU-2018]|uniref:Cysteine protease n=1 Tax=Yasminevirus sp. GU-2018 TaxID=2420051 RepID=A0A5K0U863_9VIRU|nr:cysteine protease [Yasminevirus sp. GU-2018]
MYQQAMYLQNNSYKFVPSRLNTWFNAIYTGDGTSPDRTKTKYGNWGTSTTRAVMSMKQDWYGVCREETYPYDSAPNGYIGSDGVASNGPGPVTKKADSEGHLAHAFDVVTLDHSVSAVKLALHSKQRPVSMAFDVYNSGFYGDGTGRNLGELHLPVVVTDNNNVGLRIDYNFVYYDDVKKVNRRDIAGNHAVCIVGYDDFKRFRKLSYDKGPVVGTGSYANTYGGRWNGKFRDNVDGTPAYEKYVGAFLVRNSWGANWGVGSDGVSTNADDRGYFWMPYAFFNGEDDANQFVTNTCGEFLVLEKNVSGQVVTNPSSWSFNPFIKFFGDIYRFFPAIRFEPQVVQTRGIVPKTNYKDLVIDSTFNLNGGRA